MPNDLESLRAIIADLQKALEIIQHEATKMPKTEARFIRIADYARSAYLKAKEAMGEGIDSR